MTTLHSITTTTPNGIFHTIIDANDIARASGFGGIHELIKRLPANLRNLPIEPVQNHPYKASVQAYYQGNTKALDTILRDQDGSEFQQSVWKAISSIPHGKTLSYKELAVASGNPTAIRAAGTTCGRNRLILLVPCHRVLKSDGSIGSYLYGPVIKESLLRHERAI